MSGRHLSQQKQNGDPEKSRSPYPRVKTSSQEAEVRGDDGAGLEKRIAGIAKTIADSGEGHRKAMYKGAAECAAMARSVQPILGSSDHLFGGRLKQHWLKKKKSSLEIYRFLIQSAFSYDKQASKVFTATRVMFERGTSADQFVRRLDQYGGFDKLRVRDANKAGRKESIGETSSAAKEQDAAGNKTTDDRRSVPHVDPTHPKITAVYSRKFRSKVERMALNDKFKIEVVVVDDDKKRPIIRVVAIRKLTDKLQSEH